MYRGFENLLTGRGALDGLVITPRICGICTTSHQLAAVRALDMIAHAAPPPNALRVRNVSLMTEHLQSDIRHTFLMFAGDLANPAYQNQALFAEAVSRYEPFRGKTVIEVIRETKRLIEVIAILGGQWPHSSFMVPGGVTSIPSTADLLQCQLLLKQFRQWYEHRILGCTIERWLEVQSGVELDAWLEECDAHRGSDLGFFIQYARAIGLDRVGRGTGAFISFGSLDLPSDTQVRTPTGNGQLIPAGFAQDGQVHEFDQGKVAEHVAHSWYLDYDGGRHPFDGETSPWGPGRQELKYSWAKAPRYDGMAAETGALAEMVIAGHPLFTDLMSRGGPSVLVRQLARLVRPCQLIPAVATWLEEATKQGEFYALPGEITDGQGFGLIQATRGALGHWVQIEDRTIKHYQIITPTAWNASPRDSNEVRGPIEEALIGTLIQDESNPVELGHVVRSFDPCLVCTVHLVSRKRTVGRVTVGAL
jgi:hydrogenase large subunit